LERRDLPLWDGATLAPFKKEMVLSGKKLVEFLSARMILFLKKKKRPTVTLPEIFGKRSNTQFDALVKRYGEPEYDVKDGQPHVSQYGVAVFPSGEQFVIDAKTGEVLKRNERVRYIGVSKGFHFYIHEDHELLIGDHAKPSFPRTRP
jgi:hypothetical protein